MLSKKLVCWNTISRSFLSFIFVVLPGWCDSSTQASGLTPLSLHSYFRSLCSFLPFPCFFSLFSVFISFPLTSLVKDSKGNGNEFPLVSCAQRAGRKWSRQWALIASQHAESQLMSLNLLSFFSFLGPKSLFSVSYLFYFVLWTRPPSMNAEQWVGWTG